MKLHNRLHNIIKCFMLIDEYIKEIRTINDGLNKNNIGNQ